MSGVSCKALGSDDLGNEYWRFPIANDLFVRLNLAGAVDTDYEDFQKLILSQRRKQQLGGVASSLLEPTTTSAVATTVTKLNDGGVSQQSESRHWIRLQNVHEIRALVDLLNTSNISDREKTLKRNIVNYVLIEKNFDSSTVAASAAATTVAPVAAANQSDASSAIATNLASVEEEEPTMITSSNNTNNNIDTINNATVSEPDTQGKLVVTDPKLKKVIDNTPVSLKLLTNKGKDIEPTFVITKESVFNEFGLDDSEDAEDNDDANFEYFTYNKRK